MPAAIQAAISMPTPIKIITAGKPILITLRKWLSMSFHLPLRSQTNIPVITMPQASGICGVKSLNTKNCTINKMVVSTKGAMSSKNEPLGGKLVGSLAGECWGLFKSDMRTFLLCHLHRHRAKKSIR